jgi:hypothetical protein
MSSLDAFLNYFAYRAACRFTKEDTLEVESLLSVCWDHFAGSHDGGMKAEELIGRTQDLEWSPPRLTFNVERHAGAVNGSTTATVQYWEVSLERETAAMIESESGQIIPMGRRIDESSIAAELASAISEQREDARIEWVAVNRVRISTSERIPGTNGMTTTRQRRRFVAEIEQLLQPLGWRLTNRNPLTFEQQTTDFSKTDHANLNAAPAFPESLPSEVVNLADRRRLSTPFPSDIWGFSESPSSTCGRRPMDIQMECAPTTPCGRLTCEGCTSPYRDRWIQRTLAVAKSYPGEHHMLSVILAHLSDGLIPTINIKRFRADLRADLRQVGVHGLLLRGGLDATWDAAQDRWLLHARALAIGIPPDAWRTIRAANIRYNKYSGRKGRVKVHVFATLRGRYQTS